MMAYPMVDSLYGSFNGSFDGSSDVPPKDTFLEIPIEEANCGD